MRMRSFHADDLGDYVSSSPVNTEKHDSGKSIKDEFNSAGETSISGISQEMDKASVDPKSEAESSEKAMNSPGLKVDIPQAEKSTDTIDSTSEKPAANDLDDWQEVSAEDDHYRKITRMVEHDDDIQEIYNGSIILGVDSHGKFKTFIIC